MISINKLHTHTHSSADFTRNIDLIWPSVSNEEKTVYNLASLVKNLNWFIENAPTLMRICNALGILLKFDLNAKYIQTQNSSANTDEPIWNNVR